MTNYCDVNDVIAIKRALSNDEKSRAEALIPIVCSRLRVEAGKVGKDLDFMIVENPDLANIAKQVVVDIVDRELLAGGNSSTSPFSQFSESALGYSVSGTFANPAGGLFIKNAELAALGIKRQRYGVIDMTGGCGC